MLIFLLFKHEFDFKLFLIYINSIFKIFLFYFFYFKIGIRNRKSKICEFSDLFRCIYHRIKHLNAFFFIFKFYFIVFIFTPSIIKIIECYGLLASL